MEAAGDIFSLIHASACIREFLVSWEALSKPAFELIPFRSRNTFGGIHLFVQVRELCFYSVQFGLRACFELFTAQLDLLAQSGSLFLEFGDLAAHIGEHLVLLRDHGALVEEPSADRCCSGQKVYIRPVYAIAAKINAASRFIVLALPGRSPIPGRKR